MDVIDATFDAEVLGSEIPADPLAGLDCVLAANPPLDLAACSLAISRPENRIYDQNFVRMLRREVARLHAVRHEDDTPPVHGQ